MKKLPKTTLWLPLISGITAVVSLCFFVFDWWVTFSPRVLFWGILFVVSVTMLIMSFILGRINKRKAETNSEKKKRLVNRIFVCSAIISAILLCLIVLIYIFGTSWSALKLFFLCLFLFIASCTVCLASFIAKDRRKFNRQEKIAFGVCLGSGIAAFVLYWILMRFSQTFSKVGCLEIVEFLFLAFIIMCLITFVAFLVLRHMNKLKSEKDINKNHLTFD